MEMKRTIIGAGAVAAVAGAAFIGTQIVKTPTPMSIAPTVTQSAAATSGTQATITAPLLNGEPTAQAGTEGVWKSMNADAGSVIAKSSSGAATEVAHSVAPATTGAGKNSPTISKGSGAIPRTGGGTAPALGSPYLNSMIDPAAPSPTSPIRSRAFAASTMSIAGASPPKPSPPEWTRCTMSWSQTLVSGQWVFATTLNDQDVQDLATAVRWWADIQKNHADIARNMAWIDCAGYRVRDYRLNANGKSPIDFYGAQGLDSPLGSCQFTIVVNRPAVSAALPLIVTVNGAEHPATFVSCDPTATTTCTFSYSAPCELERQATTARFAGPVTVSCIHGDTKTVSDGPCE